MDNPPQLGPETCSPPLSAPAEAVAAESARSSLVWDNALPIAALHLLGAFALLPWLFSWTGVVVAILGWQFFGTVGITLTYHRLLAHRSFRTSRRLEHLLALIGVCALEGPPAQWVAVHRIHHRHSDQPDDPHSPRHGFWWSHVGWMVRKRAEQGPVNFYARDLLKDPFYRDLQSGFAWSKIYLAHALLYLLAGLAAGYALHGDAQSSLQFGLSLFVWGVGVRQLLVWHATWSINSFTHGFGYQNHATGDGSRNNPLVAALSAGEGWHNNHHHAPASACNWHKWWEIDQTYCLIKVMQALGLVHDVVEYRGRAPVGSPSGR